MWLPRRVNGAFGRQVQMLREMYEADGPLVVIRFRAMWTNR